MVVNTLVVFHRRQFPACSWRMLEAIFDILEQSAKYVTVTKPRRPTCLLPFRHRLRYTAECQTPSSERRHRQQPPSAPTGAYPRLLCSETPGSGFVTVTYFSQPFFFLMLPWIACGGETG